MDAFVQLALIEKAKQVFARDPGLMLAFPLLSPVSFTTEELAALSRPETPADYTAAADFARIFNFLPQDLVASASERMLWDLYGDVLRRAEVAISAGAGGSSEASVALYDTAADGTRTEAEVYRRYRQYRDAWFVAQENYATHRLTGEFSEDPAVRQAWTTIDEPALRAAIEAAELAWEQLGRRTAVELALRAERDFTLREPAVRWKEWADAFNPDLDVKTDPNTGVRYAPTGFSPLNFAEQEDWLDFDLSAGEMKALVDAAAPELKSVLDDDGDSDIERISFQYRSVVLVRPWFRSEVLTSRIWRSNEADLLLSDGAEPPYGCCPAYVSACVFVRRIVEVKKPTPGEGAGGSRTVPHFAVGAIRPERLVHRELRVDRSILATVAQRRKFAVARPLEPKAVASGSLRGFEAIRRKGFKLAPTPAAGSATALGKRRRLLGMGRMFDLLSERPGVPVTDATPSPASSAPPEPAPPRAPPREEISVLAYICKRLPKAPDPAPGQRWI